MREKLIIYSAVVILTGVFYSYGAFVNGGAETHVDHLHAVSRGNRHADLPDLSSWPEASRKAAVRMETKYGKPGAVTSDMLIWKKNGIWLKTIVYKEEMAHDFPSPHTDVLEQWINYRVPEGSYNDMASFDGSITCNRTNGTISSRCASEEMNILALNLGYDVFYNGKSIEQARREFDKEAAVIINGKNPEYARKLNFSNDHSAPDKDKPFQILRGKSGPGNAGQ